MAKKRDYQAEHVANVEAYVHRIRLLYYAAIREAVRMGVSVKFDPKKPFTFSQFPALNTRVKELFSNLSSKMLQTLDAGTQHEWLLSSAKNDALVHSILPTTKMPPESFERYMNRNLEALKEFQARKSDGMNLSDRVWKQTEQFKNELELGIDVGLAEGRSADQISRDIRGYLENPVMLFRRVRDARGILHLSKAAKSYNPGQGVYRSSYKNAMRVTRSEINMAYRSADHERWQQLDFIVGFELRRSNNPYACVVCESLKGRYPKTFRFRQWHPQCRCNCISILASKSEISDLTEKILNGEDTSGFKSVNEVTQMPEGWTSWMNENKDRLLRAKSVPYWIKDNFKGGKVTGGLNIALPGRAKQTSARSFVPDTLANYEEELGVRVDKTIFQYLNKNVPLTNTGSGAYFDLERVIVNIPHDSDRKASKWKSESVVYHEYGHAIDWQSNLRKKSEVKDLMNKFRQKFSLGNDKIYRELSETMYDEGYEKYMSGEMEEMFQSVAAQDTLMSLNSSYGQGHGEDYWKQEGFPEAEFIAHAFENKFIGNPIFKRHMPELYQDMIDMLDNLLSKLE